MKAKTILFALLTMLGSQLAFSQRSLPAAVRPYAENWTYTLVNAMHRAGFEMPTVSDRHPKTGALQQRNALQLDSTKTFHEYNSETGDSTPAFRTRYLYPFSDSKVEINSYYSDGLWLPLNRVAYIADDQQRLVEIIAEIWNPETQDYQFDSYLEIYPHGDSHELIDSLATSVWDTASGTWNTIMTVGNSFDGDRLLESLTTLAYLGSPVIFRERYSYDAVGDNFLIEESGIFDGEETPTSKTELTYLNHQPIEVTTYDTDGVDVYPYSRRNIAYTLFGAVRKEMNFIWDLEQQNFQLFQTTDYFYDNEQRLAGKEIVHIQPNAWDVKERIAYSYVQDENLYMEWHFNWNDDLFDWILDTKKIFYYSGLTAVDPEPKNGLALRAWPNPSTGTVQLDLQQAGTVQIFNQTGQLVQSRELQPGQVLDISGLAAGAYTFLAQQGADTAQGKVMKQ
jgi:hypothetical protein